MHHGGVAAVEPDLALINPVSARVEDLDDAEDGLDPFGEGQDQLTRRDPYRGSHARLGMIEKGMG